MQGKQQTFFSEKSIVNKQVADSVDIGNVVKKTSEIFEELLLPSNKQSIVNKELELEVVVSKCRF